MNQVSEAITSVFGIVIVGAIMFEIRRRRKRLRDLYNVLDDEDRHVVADLDELVRSGQLHPFVGK